MHIVVIPTMNIHLCSKLVDCLITGIAKPDKIVILNNSDQYFSKEDMRNINYIDVINFEKNIGVNAAWNIGLMIAKEKSANLTILNDDILIKKDFIKRINNLLECAPYDIPVFCPSTVLDFVLFEKIIVDDCRSQISSMKRREGWAFTIRDRFVKVITPIPKELFIFCGDDWIWKETVKFGVKWAKDEKNIIYHAVGASKNKELYALLKHEKRIFNNYGKDNAW